MGYEALLKEAVECITRHAASKSFVDGSKIPYTIYQPVEPIITGVKRWVGVAKGFDHTKPETWIQTFDNITGQLIERPRSSVSEIDQWLRTNCYFTKPSTTKAWIITQWLDRNEGLEVITENDRKLMEFEIAGAGKFAVVYSGKDIDQIRFDFDSQDEIIKAMVEQFWDGRKYIRIDKDKDGKIVCENHKFSGRKYSGQLIDMIDNLKKYEAYNIPRVVILQGKPGTGKSTLCENAAQALDRRTIIFPNSYIESVTKSEWEDLINCLDPYCVIVDDIDRVNDQQLQKSLGMFEEGNYHVAITLFTTNDVNRIPDAFKRPGRVSLILEVPNPPPEIQVELLDNLINSILEDKTLAKLAREGIRGTHIHEEMCKMLYEGVSGAHIKELLYRYIVDGWDTYKIPENDIVFKPFIKRLNRDSATQSDKVQRG